MKASKSIMALAIMMALPAFANAQVVTTPTDPSGVVSDVVTTNSAPTQTAVLTNAQLSQQYKLQMEVINQELKTLKAQAKLYKTDPVKSAEVVSRTASKKSELADVKAKKKIVDKALATEKASKKAAEKAEKAQRKAAAAAAKAAMLQQPVNKK